MAELGGPEIPGPGEGATRAPEGLSEEAKQRFVAAAFAMKVIQREERKSKKRDTRVARTIIQFLSDNRYTHLFLLISRLVARDCPSIFILAILSLINEECAKVVEEYLFEAGVKVDKQTIAAHVPLTSSQRLSTEANRILVEWITRLQMVLNLETEPILSRLMVDEKNIEGSVHELTTFILQEFFHSPVGGALEIPFETLHPLTASILQTVFEPFMDEVERILTERQRQEAATKPQPTEEA